MLTRLKFAVAGLMVGVLSVFVTVREISDGAPLEDAIWYVLTSVLFLGFGIWASTSSVRSLFDRDAEERESFRRAKSARPPADSQS